MQIVVETPNSPGTQFNENTDDYIRKMFNYLNSKEDGFSETYREFQQHCTSFTTLSYIRNIFPFLKNAEIINDYSNVNKKLFTELGEAYYLCVDSLEKIKSDEEKSGLEKFRQLKQQIVRQALSNIIKASDAGYAIIFKWILLHLKKFEKIDESEFALILYVLQKKKSFAEYEKILNEQRGRISFFVNVVEKGTDNVKKVSKITSYSYFMGSLKTAGVVSEKSIDGYFSCICKNADIEDML